LAAKSVPSVWKRESFGSKSLPTVWGCFVWSYEYVRMEDIDERVFVLIAERALIAERVLSDEPVLLFMSFFAVNDASSIFFVF